MLLRDYEMPWRKAYELYAAAAWLLASLVMLRPDGVPLRLQVVAVSAALAFAFVRARQGTSILRIRSALTGKAMEKMDLNRFATLTEDPAQLYFGYGFAWKPVHSQRLYELMKIDYTKLTVSPTVSRLLGVELASQSEEEIGMPFIHGVEFAEKPLYRPLQNFEGGTLIVGTTQAGKGVMLANLITQAVRRGDIVIVIDPKNSGRLRRLVKKACDTYRKPDTYLFFHPAFPEQGVRLDFTFNWQKPTEIASRIQAIMPHDTAGAFSAFGWDAVNVVVGGLVDLEERPNLVKLARYIEGGIEPVLQASLRRLYERTLGPEWRNLPAMAALFDKAKRGQIKSPSASATHELLALVEYYEHELSQDLRDKILDSQVRVFRHNREHYQKITASLLPILSMLTSGELGRSLSPDPFDMNDTRPIMNYQKIEEGEHVLYMCLDSMPDPAVATAIGALAAADLAARAGMRYNLGLPRRIALFVDEVTNVINRPLIEIMNKGAEGGIYTTVAMQTLADMAEKLGSQDAARMALGNLNNVIAFRSTDRPTQDFIVETFGQTMIHTVKVGQNVGVDSHIGDFSAGSSSSITESFEDSVPSSILAKLPNLQYFASVSGGRLYKGRVTLLDPGAEPPLRKGAA